MRVLAIAAVLFATSTAGAEGERRTTVSFGVVFGIQSLPDKMPSGDGIASPQVAKVAEGFGGPRLVLAFERPFPAYPIVPGYRVETQLVPELIGGAFVRERADVTRADMMLGIGVRGELRIAQLRMGLMRVSAKMSLYAAARALVVGEDRDRMLEFALGEYFLLGSSGWRLGFEFGGMSRDQDRLVEAQRGFISQVFLGGTL
jgi:hypothetical protein